MGDMADYYTDLALNQHMYPDFEELYLDEKDELDFIDQEVWITADGRKINVSDMTTNHLQNSIARIRREKWRLDYLPLLQKELEKRKDKSIVL